MNISDNLKRAITYVWGQIASDVGQDIDNEDAIELSFDADRLVSVAENPAAQAELTELVKTYTYSNVLVALGEQIALV